MPTLAELQQRCRELGLEVEGKSKAPFVEALRTYHLGKDGQLPYTELDFQLCFDYGKLDPRQQSVLWVDKNDWCFQQKINGVRLAVHFVRDVGIFCHSRTVSAHSFRRVELSDRLVFGSYKPDFSATIDCEALAGDLQTTTCLLHMSPEESRRLQMEKTPLNFHVFDIVHWKDEDLRHRRLDERLGFLKDVREAITRTRLEPFFRFPLFRFTGKREFYDQILREGGEGVVAKNLNSRYIAARAVIFI